MHYFSIEELSHSDTATKYNIDNTPNYNEEQNLIALVDNILDPVREELGHPIYVNSGYRSTRLNSLVGGSRSSQHCKGQAVDITTKDGKYNKELFELLKKYDHDQLIDEHNLSWIHISYKNEGGNRNQVMYATKKGGKTIYTIKYE